MQKYTDFLNSGFGKTGNIFAEAKKALSKKEIETALKSDEAKAKPKDKVTLKKAPWEEETQINEDDYAKEMYKKGASAAVMQSVPPGPRAHPEYVRGYKEKTAELNKKYGIKENNIFSDNELAHIMSISESDYSSAQGDSESGGNSEYKDKLRRMYGAKREYEQSASLYRHEYHQGREHFEKGEGDFDFHGNPYHHADPKYHAWRQGHLDAAGPEDDEDK